jgi:hypothetical protein
MNTSTRKEKPRKEKLECPPEKAFTEILPPGKP